MVDGQHNYTTFSRMELIVWSFQKSLLFKGIYALSSIDVFLINLLVLSKLSLFHRLTIVMKKDASI
jgi:hypothetical protein